MKPRAILISVDFADILAITLPYNLHHFESVHVVTAPHDNATISVAAEHECPVFITNAFYEDGAHFNKFRALERALDYLGRDGWLCIMDADVLWPQSAKLNLTFGHLHGPPRRILDPVQLPLPPEAHWSDFHTQRNSLREFPGYSQIFHADDPHLGPPPWHDINFKHAGRADSFFQNKWPKEHKIRLPFHVLHIGKNGQDWCGRTSDYLDGSTHHLSQQRKEWLTKIRSSPLPRGSDRYAHEKTSLKDPFPLDHPGDANDLP